MAVVSSIRHGAITNEYNEGANYLKRFLQYAEMVSLGQMQGARSILDSLVLRKQESPSDSRPSLVREQIRQQLQALGYVVDEQIGQSDFKCSLAVKARPEDQAYRLGILLDDERHYLNDNLIEQYYQRPAILERFGWKVLQVFSRDWLHQPQKVMDLIVGELRAASDERRAGSDEELRAVSNELRARAGEEVSAGVGLGMGSHAAASPYDHLAFRRLHYRDGSSDKFWEAATDENKLVVRWGRRGSKGQIQLKTFPDSEAAQKEMERSIKEKLGAGYEG